MSLLVLCPRCRQHVSVQESMAGKPARCPYCKSPFQVPSLSQLSSPPLAQAEKFPTYGVLSPENPTALSELDLRSHPSPAPRKAKALPREYRSRQAGSPRISPTLSLGLMSAGIVIILLGVVIGMVARFSHEPTPPSQGKREPSVARAKPRPLSDPIVSPGSRETSPISKATLDEPGENKDEALEKAPSEEATESKQPAEGCPSVERKEASPPIDTPTSTEASRPEGAPSSLPARRRLSGDELYRRLVKSCVYVRNVRSWGSGSLIDRQRKLILTNYHVVGESAEVFVSFPCYDSSGELIVAGDFYERAYKRKELIRGKVLRLAKGQDLALVELDTVPEGTQPLKLAPRRASPGQAVHSVGNPGASDARWQYTSGTVRQLSHKTWKARGASGIHAFDADILETQSPTNPGDSGGPLVNDALQLVGVTQGADISANELSFFIDVSEVRKLLQACDVPLSEVTAEADGAANGIVETSDVFSLIKCLEDKDARVRTEAVHRLVELGPQARPAARALIKALSDEESLVRQNAARALGKLGSQTRDLVRKAVFKCLEDADGDVRLAALEALANLGAPDLSELPKLLSLLHSSVEKQHLQPCILIAHSLALLGPRAKDAVPDLRELLRSEDRSTRVAALLALGKIGPAARDAAPELSEALKDSDRSVRIQAAIALTTLDPTLVGAGKNALSVLVQGLRPASRAESTNTQIQALVKEISAVLVKLGEPAVERLLRALKSEFKRGRSRTEAGDLDALAREAALKIIAEIGPPARSNQTIAILAELQRGDPYPSVKEAARHAFLAVQEAR